MKDENIYIKKDNGRYEPVGIWTNRDYMFDGIWYVRHSKYTKSITSVPYLATMFHMDVNPVNINLVCGLEDNVDYIINSPEWKELFDKNNGYSLNDIVHLCVKKLYERQFENNENKLKSNESSNI